MANLLILFVVFQRLIKVYSECGERSTGYTSTSHLLRDDDTNSGNMFFLPSDFWNISCCSVISAWEFIPLKTGVVHFQIWRPVNSTSIYEFKASTSYEVKAGDVGNLINHTLMSGQKITVLSEDRIGWYCFKGNILSYQNCSDERCQQATRFLNRTIMPSSGEAVDWDDDEVQPLRNRSYILKVYMQNNSAPYLSQTTDVVKVHQDVPIGTTVTPLDVKDDDMDDEIKYSLSHVLFSLNTTSKSSVCIETKSLLNSTADQNINLTVEAWDSCMNNLTITFRVSIILPEQNITNGSFTSPSSTTTIVTTDVTPRTYMRKGADQDELILGVTMSLLIIGAIVGIIVYRYNYIQSKARPQPHKSRNTERAEIYSVSNNISHEEKALDLEEEEENVSHRRIIVRISDVNSNSKSPTTVL